MAKKRFLLLKFYGTPIEKGKGRELFDVNAVDIDMGASFPIYPGYDDIEVYVEEIDANS